jgi:hypothetical protein
MATDTDECFNCGKKGHFASRRVAWSGRRGQTQRLSFLGMQQEDLDSDYSGDDQYDATPDGYIEELCSDDDNGVNDDYEHQERPETFKAIVTHLSDDETDSEDTQELYRLSSHMAMGMHQPKDRPAWRHDAGLRDTARSRSFNPPESTNFGEKGRSRR